jgi:hypothetical protein
MLPSRAISVAAASAVALAVLSAVGPVDAARGGGGAGGGGSTGSSSIVLDQAAPIVHGQPVTFTVSTTATDRPFSQVNCFQGGTLVYQSTRGHFEDYYFYFGDPIHYLSSSAWVGGDADCTAELTYKSRNGRTSTLAKTSFRVEG